MMAGRVRAYLAMSLDGFIAGPGDDLSWLPEPELGEPLPDGALSFEAFIGAVGALLMGRRTYDVVRGMDVPWPYGGRPVLVATHRPLDEDPPSTVRAVTGGVEALVAEALATAKGGDVYIDGGTLVRHACDAGLVDELTLTLAPVALGAGHPLFGGLARPYGMKLMDVYRFPGGMVQLRLVPKSSHSPGRGPVTVGPDPETPEP
jgi:dihydrofolate reductase